MKKLKRLCLVLLLVLTIVSIVNITDHNTREGNLRQLKTSPHHNYLSLSDHNEAATLNMFSRYPQIHKIHGTELHMTNLNKTNTNSSLSKLNTSATADDISAYFRNRNQRITPMDHNFIVRGQPCSVEQSPYLLILCISKYDHLATRQVIRETWGSVSQTKIWPMTASKITDVRLIFVLGRKSLDAKERARFEREDKDHGDIVVADFVDSYHNLTRKVVMGLKWANRFCLNLKFVLKVDEDTFIHVVNLVTYLKTLEVSEKGVMLGHIYSKPAVRREGKWRLQSDIYPYPFFPPYVSGNSYVISGNILTRVIAAVERLPYIFIEDVSITGVVRHYINATLLNDNGFTCFGRPPPNLCDFHSKLIKSATKTTDSFKYEIWRALYQPFTICKRREWDMIKRKMRFYHNRKRMMGNHW